MQPPVAASAAVRGARTAGATSPARAVLNQQLVRYAVDSYPHYQGQAQHIGAAAALTVLDAHTAVMAASG